MEPVRLIQIVVKFTAILTNVLINYPNDIISVLKLYAGRHDSQIQTFQSVTFNKVTYELQEF